MKRLLLLSGLLVVAVGIWIAAVNIDTNAQSEKKAEKIEAVDTKDGLQVGDKAPNFKLKNVDGKMVSLTDDRFKDAKGFIVTFTCNTCPVAQAYEQRIIDLHKKMAPKGYPVIAIQPNDPEAKAGDSFSEMQKRAEAKSYPFVYLLDEGQKVHPKYGATRTPEIYLLDKDMTLVYTGAIDNNQNEEQVSTNYVEDAIAALEAGKEPNPSFTKAVGCSIKYKKVN